jgi:hypothetical protein
MHANSYIQSLISRAVLDVSFAKKMEDTGTGINNGESVKLPAGFHRSLSRIQLFSAFIAKVKHNYLWAYFSLTLALLKKYRMELEVFGKYLPQHDENRRNKTLSAGYKTILFTNFLVKYLAAQKGTAAQVVLNVLKHELAVKKINACIESAVETVQIMKPLLSAVPVIKGCISITEMTLNPAVINTIVKKEKLPYLYKKPKTICYWIPQAAGEMKVFEITKKTGALLLEINGTITVKALRGKYSGQHTANDFMALLKSLQQFSVISFKQ